MTFKHRGMKSGPSHEQLLRAQNQMRSTSQNDALQPNQGYFSNNFVVDKDNSMETGERAIGSNRQVQARSTFVSNIEEDAEAKPLNKMLPKKESDLAENISNAYSNNRRGSSNNSKEIKIAVGSKDQISGAFTTETFKGTKRDSNLGSQKRQPATSEKNAILGNLKVSGTRNERTDLLNGVINSAKSNVNKHIRNQTEVAY